MNTISLNCNMEFCFRFSFFIIVQTNSYQFCTLLSNNKYPTNLHLAVYFTNIFWDNMFNTMGNEFNQLLLHVQQLTVIEHTQVIQFEFYKYLNKWNIKILQEFLRQEAIFEQLVNGAMQSFHKGFLSPWKDDLRRAQVGAAFIDKEQRLKQIEEMLVFRLFVYWRIYDWNADLLRCATA